METICGPSYSLATTNPEIVFSQSLHSTEKYFVLEQRMMSHWPNLKD